MKSSRVFRSLAAAAAAVALLAAPAGGAHASYPPGGPGTIESSKSECMYNNDGELVSSVVITFDYEVTVPSATLTVTRDGGDVVYRADVTMGVGVVSFPLDGLAVFLSHTAELYANGERVLVTEIGCPIPSVTGPNDDSDTDAGAGATKTQAAAATAATNAKPVTGSASWPVAAGALTLLTAGVAMVIATRRRSLAN